MTARKLREVLDDAEPMQSDAEPPAPLLRPRASAAPYPIDNLGPVLGPAVLAIVDKVQVPHALAAQSVLAAAALAAQAHADILLPTGQARPLSCYFVTVAESGDRKSASDHEAMAPIRHRETQLADEHRTDILAYRNAKDSWDAARTHAINQNKATGAAAMKAALDSLGPEPDRPLDPMILATDPTAEGRAKAFVTGQPSAGIFSAEGGAFVGGHAMNADNRLKTAAALSELWDGSPIRRVRAADGTVFLKGRRQSAHLMVQPVAANALLNDDILRSQGLLSRLLVAAPDSLAGTRMWKEPPASAAPALARYHARILSIMERPAPHAEGDPGELTPRQLPLSGAARDVWTSYADQVEREILGPRADARGFAAKLAEHAARLAGVLTLVDDIDAAEIGEGRMRDGLMLAEFYMTEALRLADGHSADPKVVRAEKLRRWLHDVWQEPLVSVTVVQQCSPVRGDAGPTRDLLAILTDHGFLVPVDGGGIVGGSKRREAWKIRRP